MQNFYSDNLAEGIRLLYCQTDSSLYNKAVSLLEQAAEENEADVSGCRI